MKIAYITMRFPKRSETFCQVETRVLSQLGHEVSVLALHPEKPADETSLEGTGVSASRLHRPSARVSLADLGLVLRHLPLALRLVGALLRSCWLTPRHLVKSFVLLPAAMGLFHRLRQQQPDVVHLFWGHYPALVGWLWLAASPVHKVSMFLGAYDLMYRFPLSRVVGQCIQQQGRGRLFTHARVNLQAIGDFGLDESQVDVSYRGVDLAHLPWQPGRTVPERILSAGRLIPEKGMATLIQAFSEVAKHMPAVELVIAGDGPQRAELVALADQLGVLPQVRFTGYLSQEHLFAEMAQADVFALLSTSWSERLPNVVKEAMALGVRPLVLESPGMRELIPSDAIGTVIEDDGVETVSQALVASLGLTNKSQNQPGDEVLRRDYIGNHFDATVNMKRRCQLWQSCLNQPASVNN